jgi:hypothetical protein
MSSDNETLKQQNTKKTFVLIARDHSSGFIVQYLLLLDVIEHRRMAERSTALELLVPLDHLDILDELKPEMRRIVLV